MNKETENNLHNQIKETFHKAWCDALESKVREVSPVIVPVTARLPDDVIAPHPTVPKPLTFPLVSNV